jgi:hypothetical protein
MKTSMASSLKATQLTLWESFCLKRKGMRDGKIGFPIQDENGEWSSPWISKENEAYCELSAKIWAQSERKNAPLFSEISEMASNIAYKQTQIEELKTESASSDFAAIYPGESGCASPAKDRRQDEFKRSSKKAGLKAYIEQAQDKISRHKSTIAEDENVARLSCESAKHHANQRIAAYWHGLICKNVKIALPVNPPKVQDSDAERIYFSCHELPHTDGKVIEMRA